MIFTILCPNYVHYSAGVRVLWRLGNLLGLLGHKVYYINYQANPQPAPAWSTMEAAPGNCTQGLVIAPEVFPELAIPHVRWALNKPGLLGGPKTYGAGTQVYHWSPELEESTKEASPDGTSKQFMIGSLDAPNLTPTTRKLNLWYRGKYTDLVDLGKHTYEVEMTRHWPSTKVQYWELLNQAISLKSYDDFSGTNLEAYLWGVQVSIWDGVRFMLYVPPTYINDLIIDDAKDLVKVEAFVNSLQ